MLAHPTHERLIALGLPGMAKAFEDQRRSPDIAALSFEERIGLMVAGMGEASSTIGRRACSRPWRSPAAMAATAACSKPSLASSS
jgi:hypothetical protein